MLLFLVILPYNVWTCYTLRDDDFDQLVFVRILSICIDALFNRISECFTASANSQNHKSIHTRAIQKVRSVSV